MERKVDNVVSCVEQVALVIEPKDKEATTMYKQALELLSQALEVWPNANVKFNYLEKLFNSMQPSQSKDPSTALAQGLDVMNKVLEKQPHLFIRNNINQISQVVTYNKHLLVFLFLGFIIIIFWHSCFSYVYIRF